MHLYDSSFLYSGRQMLSVYYHNKVNQSIRKFIEYFGIQPRIGDFLSGQIDFVMNTNIEALIVSFI